jgi:SNF2 family DNA or RNA helicase
VTPPRYQVHGEIHADGETLVLFATGNIVEAVGRLHLLTPHFTGTQPAGGLRVPLRWPVICQLAGEMGQGWLPGPRLRAWIHEQVRVRSVLPELKARVNASAPDPRSYQVTGAQLIAAGKHALICDDPGTGKTLTTLLGLLELRERGALALAAPMLVVCPASVVDSWIRDAERWMPWRVSAWRGPLRARLVDARHDLYVTSYETMTRDVDPAKGTAPLLTKAFSAVVLDEAHLIKSAKSSRSKAAIKLARKAAVVIPLSGTPITHHAGDLHQALKAMDPVSWPSSERFAARYLDSVPGDYSDDVLGLNRYREPEFRQCLAGHYRRLAKEDVLPELPPKVYSQRVVTLSPPARRAYDEMERDMLATLEDGQELPAFDALAQLQRLLALANSACDVEITHGPDVDEVTGLPKMHVHVHPKEGSPKIDELVEILREREGRQSVVFAPSAKLIRLAGARLEGEGFRVGYVIGNQSMRDRTQVIAEFQLGGCASLDVVLATTGAGGVGITLTAADTVVFLQRPWSYVEASQAEDRAHRIGSEIHESIEVIDIIAENTVDSQVRQVLAGKAQALAELLGDPRIAMRCLGGAA